MGCAFLKQQKVNWDTCKSDVSCYEDAKQWQSTGELVGGLAGSAVPGVAIPLQKGVGWLSLTLAMLIGGHALNKKKESVKGD